MTKRMNFTLCLDNSETKSYSLDKEKGEMTFQGWNIINPENIIKEELEDYFEETINDLIILSKKEMAYSCSRYSEGDLASDSGYGYWINYHDTWKKGLGKCTTFSIKYKLTNNG